MNKNKVLEALIDKEWIKKDKEYGGYWYNGRPEEIHKFVYQIAQKYADQQRKEMIEKIEYRFYGANEPKIKDIIESLKTK